MESWSKVKQQGGMVGGIRVEGSSERLVVARQIPPGREGRGVSRRLPMVRFQQSAQTPDANDLTPISFVLRLDDPMDSLVNPLMMTVLEVLTQDVAQLRFGREDEIVETFLPDGPHEALRVGTQIRTSRW